LKDKKKILFLIGSMQGGGAQRVVMEVINNLDRSRFIPILTLYTKQGPYLNYLKKDIPIYELTGCSGGYKKMLRTIKHVSELMNTIKPDLIMGHSIGANLALLRTAFFYKKNTPVIITEHNNFTQTIKRIRWLKRRLTRIEASFFYKRALKIVVVSQGIKLDLVDHYGMNEDQIAVVYNPVNIQGIYSTLSEGSLQSKKSHNRVKQIVAVGRLTKQKGFSDLIKAFSLVRDSVPSRLIILGEGDLRPVLEKQILEQGLSDHVDLPGFVDEPWPIIHASDIFVMSSHWEGFGNVIVEAMACGTPVISTDCDYGPREIITTGQDGLLVPVGDINAMSKAIQSILKNKIFGQQLAANAQKKVCQFDSKAVTRNYETLFDNMIYFNVSLQSS
jgi:glycosyltransferase involved in cell wall biosynthesis